MTFLGKGGLILWHKPVLVTTMLPEGGAADIEVDTSDSRAPAIDPGGHLIASFTFLEQSKDIAPYFTGHICWRCDCTEGVLCTVESQTA